MNFYQKISKNLLNIYKSDIPFYTILIIIITLRVILCAKTEIVGATADTEALAQLTVHGFWKIEYSLYRPPVVPYLAYLLSFLAIPWRLFLDICLIAASIFCCLVLKKYTNKTLALCVLILCLFNNYSIISFTEFQREPFLFVEYLLIFSLIMKFIFRIDDNKFNSIDSILLGLSAAFIILTREGEEVFIASGCFIFSFIYIFKNYKKFGPSCLIHKINESIIIPIFCVLFFCSATAITNYVMWDVPSYRGLFPYLSNFLTQVHHIESNDSSRYAPATRKSFEMAAQVSETFREFSAPILASDKEAAPYIAILRAHSSTFTNRQEIDPSRTIWALTVMLGVKYGMDEGLKVQKLKKAAQEIRYNTDKNNLINKFILLPYPFDSHIENWISAFPEGFQETAKIMTVPTREEAGVRNINDYSPELFDKALSRRDYLITDQFKSKMDTVRSYVADKYTFILLTLAFISFISGLFQKMNKNIILISGIMLTFIFARLCIYSVIFVSVAPVLRYVVFFSPIVGIFILLTSTTVGSLVREAALTLYRRLQNKQAST